MSEVKDQQIRLFGIPAVQTVKFHDLESRLLNSPIRSANRQIPRFGMRTVEFINLECRTSNATVWTFNDFEFPPSISFTSVSCDGQCPSLRQRQFAHGVSLSMDACIEALVFPVASSSQCFTVLSSRLYKRNPGF